MSRIELVDCHTHTIFSDGAGTLDENLTAARAANVTTIACTDHWGRPDFIDCSIAAPSLPSYHRAVEEAKLRFSDLEIVHGLEADWYPGCEDDVKSLREDAVFLLGSVHYLDEKPIDWFEHREIWDEVGADEVWRRYVEQWCAAATSGLFDSMAHPDLPRLFSLRGYAPTSPLDAHFDSMAEAAREGGVRVEVNTAGLTKDFAEFYPCADLLARFHRAGVGLTVGSDAHAPGRIGSAIADAYRFAASIGYTAIDVPRADGDWRRVAL